jgi:hypothetical protein
MLRETKKVRKHGNGAEPAISKNSSRKGRSDRGVNETD